MTQCVGKSLAALVLVGFFAQASFLAKADERDDELASIIELIENGNHVLASDRLQDLVEFNPDNPDVLILMGYLSHETGELGDAARYYAEALDLVPEHTDALEKQGLLFLASDRAERAKANLDHLLRVCGRACAAYKSLAAAIREYDVR